MGPKIVLLLALVACCRCEHDTRPAGRASRRQLVEIVPVTRDSTSPSAPAPALAYIVPAPHLDTETEDSSDVEELTIYADLDSDAKEDREAEVEEREAEMEREAGETELVVRDGEENDQREDGGPAVKVHGGHAGRGGRLHLHPTYTLSFVFGR